MLQASAHNRPVRAVSSRALSAALVVAAFAGVASAQTTRTATVNFNWTDRLGNLHPLAYAWASASYNALPIFSDTPAGSFYLPANGSGTWTGTTNIPFVNSLEFSGTVESRFGTGATEWFRIVNNAGNTYVGTWGPYSATTPPPGSDTFTIAADNNTFAGTVLGMGQTIAFGRNYAVNNLGLNLPAFRVQYDAGYTGASFYNGNVASPVIRFNTNSGWCSTDIMLHELGHYVASVAGIDASPGGDHTFGGDNITGDGSGVAGRGVVGGTRLAWSEGFATYFGLSAVRAGSFHLAIPGMSGQDYDNEYANYTSSTNRAFDYANLAFTVSAETPIGRDPDGAGGTTPDNIDRRGEGSEGSVLWSMWDMFDDNNGPFSHPSYGPANPFLLNDRVTYSDVDMWNRLIRPNSPTTFRAFWSNVTNDCNTAAGRAHISGLATATKAEAVAAMGEILEAAGIAGVPTTGTAPLVFNTPRPDLTWQEGNYSNSARFEVLIFSSDWSTIVYNSGLLNDTSPTTIDNYHWLVTADIANGDYWWVILNSPAGATNLTLQANIYSWYWSGARPISVVPTPGVASLLVIGSLAQRRRRR
jgi:hypothetical protein